MVLLLLLLLLVVVVVVVTCPHHLQLDPTNVITLGRFAFFKHR